MNFIPYIVVWVVLGIIVIGAGDFPTLRLAKRKILGQSAK